MHNNKLNIFDTLTGKPQSNGSTKQVSAQKKEQLVNLLMSDRIDRKDVKDKTNDLSFNRIVNNELDKSTGKSEQKTDQIQAGKNGISNVLIENPNSLNTVHNDINQPLVFTDQTEDGDVDLILGTVDKLSNIQSGTQVIPDILPVQINTTEDQNENVEVFNQAIKNEVPFNSSINSENIKALLASRSSELQNGSYNVVNSKIDSSRLYLEVEAASKSIDSGNENPSKTIKLTLPLDILANNTSGMGSNRINVNSQPQSDASKHLETLLDKVQVKQIDISGITKSNYAGDLQPVQISLIGENQGNAMIIRSSLKKNQIKIDAESVKSIQDPITSGMISTIDAGKTILKNKINPAQSDILSQKAALPDDSGLLPDGERDDQGKPVAQDSLIGSKSNKQLFDTVLSKNKGLGGKQTMFDSNIQSRTDSFVNFNTPIETSDSTDKTEVPRNIRMMLPDNIKSILRPNGPSIMLRIEPENLGPAKLSLTMHNDKLHAKLTVTSPNAKHMLEASVNRLVDQLQKVNINVEKINITLDDSSTRQEQFHRQANWNRKMTYKNLHNEEFESNGIEHMGIIPHNMTNQYVNSSGVNLLA